MSEIMLWAVIGILSVVIAALLLKIYLLKKAAYEIRSSFASRLITDTNTLIDISSRDKSMCALADVINGQLRELRAQRHRYQQGDRELKNAIINISHDLRTPLTAIFGYLDLLKTEEKTKTCERYIDIIENRSCLLKQLTEELFQYSILIAAEETLSREPVVLNELLEESIAAFYTVLTRNGITPRIRIPEKKILRQVDRAALSRVFSNLLYNAVRYSGGDLEIVLSETGEIIFSNSAPGLTSVQAGKLFDRFYTVESGRKSTGLGLSIAKTLTQRMGGNIGARCENGILYIYIFFSV